MIAFLCCYLSMSVCGQTGVVFDAAELDGQGQPLEWPALRMVVDNREGTEPLSNVRFHPEVMGDWTGGFYWSADDPDNPFYGAPQSEAEFLVDGIKYSRGWVVYPPTREWAPGFTADPTPDDNTDPENDWDIFDEVPAGLWWTLEMAVTGTDVHLFASPAEGDLTIDGATTTYYDTDRMPQSVPEPAALAVLLVGFCALSRRHRQL